MVPLKKSNGSIPEWIQPKWKFLLSMDTINRLYSRKIEAFYERKIWKCYFYHSWSSLKGSRVITLDKLTSTEIYSILISKVQNKLSSNIYFESLFNDYNIYWIEIYVLPRFVAYNTYMQSFQCKIWNNFLSFDEIFILLEQSHLYCVCSVIYTMKYLFSFFMSVAVLNVFVRT